DRLWERVCARDPDSRERHPRCRYSSWRHRVDNARRKYADSAPAKASCAVRRCECACARGPQVPCWGPRRLFRVPAWRAGISADERDRELLHRPSFAPEPEGRQVRRRRVAADGSELTAFFSAAWTTSRYGGSQTWTFLP